MSSSIGKSFSEDSDSFYDTGKSGSSKAKLAGYTTEGSLIKLDGVLRVEASYYKKAAILTSTTFLLGAAAFLAFLKILTSMATLTVVIGVSITPFGLAAVGLGILLCIALYYGVQYCRKRCALANSNFSKPAIAGPED
jgi:hypothetical protein